MTQQENLKANKDPGTKLFKISKYLGSSVEKAIYKIKCLHQKRAKCLINNLSCYVRSLEK